MVYTKALRYETVEQLYTQAPSTRIRIFLNPQLFFADSASVHKNPNTNPHLFQSAVQSGNF